MKHISAIALALLVLAGSAHAQENNASDGEASKSYFGGGIVLGGTSLCQKGTPVSYNKAGVGWGLDFEYTFLFNRVMGIKTGMSLMSGKSTFLAGDNYEYFSDVTYPNPPAGPDWTIHYRYISNGHEETARFTHLGIPLMLRIDTRVFVASIGMKAAIPVGPMRIDYSSGSTDVSITQVEPTDNINIGAQLLGAKRYESERGSYTIKQPVWLLAAAEVGCRFNLKAVGLRPSIYAEYALNNGASAHSANMKQINFRDLPVAQTTNTLEYTNCSKNNLVQKMHYLSAGLRLTLDFGPGLYSRNAEKKGTDAPAPVAASSDGTAPKAEDLMVFIRKTNGQQQYYGSYSSGDKWSSAVAMLQLGDPADKENVTYTVSPDGKITVMALDGDGGMGGRDLYFSILNNGQWSEPRNLGSQVNCHSLDDQPAFAADGRTLYFVSDRPGGLGGSDIWFSTLQDDMTWSAAENAGSAVNSPGNERTPVFFNNRLYFASDGRNGSGGYDIYYVAFSSMNRAMGSPVNVGGNVNTPDDELGIVMMSKVSRKPNANPFSIPDQLSSYLNGGRVSNGVTMDPVYNVLFRIGSAVLLDEYSADIAKVANIIIANPSIKVEVGGHTDNTGGENRNILLSWNRAKAVYLRLIEYGVPADRLTYHGYGATQPLTSNATEEGRTINRRTEFKIISEE